MQKQKVAKTFMRISTLCGFYFFVDCFGDSLNRLAMTSIFYSRFVAKKATTIEVMAVVLCIILAQNERNRTWASIERNFVAKITQMITPEQIAKRKSLHFALF